MKASELLLLARAEVEHAPGVPMAMLDVLGALTDDGRLVADAVELLDSVTPGGWTFFQWADGAVDEVGPDGAVEIVYRYDRKKSEITALITKACIRAKRTEAMEAA